MSLDRFIEAQDAAEGGYRVALAEMRAGRKASHWIWYIFPQLAGLGNSSTARFYALRDLAEACEYLRHPVLTERLLMVLTVAADQLARGVSLEELMGGRTDSLKLVSSATLFANAAAEVSSTDGGKTAPGIRTQCERILQAAGTQGFAPCTATLRALVT